MTPDEDKIERLQDQYFKWLIAGSLPFPELIGRIYELCIGIAVTSELPIEDWNSRLQLSAAARAIELLVDHLNPDVNTGKSLRQLACRLRPIAGLTTADTPQIIVKTLIIPGDRTKEGVLVKGVSAFWFEMMRMIQADPDSIHQIDCWKWEELLAGAYKQDGWETVVLTPKRGDHGIDVIAERKDWGQLRFLLLDQMKAYKPGYLIGPDEIREMMGVLLMHPEASKGLITTTAGFTPGAFEEAASLAPRLELRPRDKLVEWLASVAVEGLRGIDTSQLNGRCRKSRPNEEG